MRCINIILLLSVFLLFSCSEKRDKQTAAQPKFTEVSFVIPDTVVEKSLLNYDKQTSLWSLNDKIYSGYIVSFYEGNIPKEKMSVLDGKKQNESILRYADGHLKEVANYHQGKLHGEKKRWTVDSPHILVAHLHYHLGKAHGEQKQWYPTGEIYKKLNLNMGKEEGIQQAFRKNGELYANYEAKNGRIFGLKKAALCYGLEDENIKYEQ